MFIRTALKKGYGAYKRFRMWFREAIMLPIRRKRLRNQDFSIISCDCTGGVIYHDLKKQFTSCTINMYMMAEDFVKFCSDIKYWVNQTMVEVESEYDFPVARLGEDGLTLYLVHYSSVAEAQRKWDERKKRINYDNLFIMMNDRNNCSEKCIEDFDELPYDNKVIFTHIPHENIESAYVIKNCEKDPFVKTMTEYLSRLSLFRRYEQFDYVSWLNGENASNC